MKRQFAFCLSTVVLAAAWYVPVSAQEATVWQIGKEDKSTLEFQALPSDKVDYDVRKSSWAVDWPSTQRPGSVYNIRFALNAKPRGEFLLKISTLTIYHRIPALQIQINGHEGVFYLHPKPLYIDDQQYRSSDLITIAIPGNYLVDGTNELALQVVDAESGGSRSNGSAGAIAYDFIRLVNDPNANVQSAPIEANVEPTIFYRQKDGKLVELVDAYLRFNGAAPAGHATLRINGATYSADLAATHDFGEERLEFEVPEWQGAAAVRLEIDAGSKHSFNLSLNAARKWTVFVVPHTHLDVGFTDFQGKVAENQVHTLMEASGLIEKYPSFRFSTDGSWILRQFLMARSKPEQEEVLSLICSGKIGIPADYFNLLTAYASLETLYHSFYDSKALALQYNLPFSYASTTDVPTYTGDYPSVLASAGIKYWAVGGNADRAPLLAYEHWNEESPFWWQGPDGEKVLFSYSRFYAQVAGVLTTNPQEATLREALPIFLEQYNKPAYKPDAVLMYGAQGENTALHPELATFATVWNQSYAYPKLQYATFSDYFKYVDDRFGAELPTYKGDMGSYWEIGVAADAYYTAEDRNNQSNAPSSEVISTVAHVADPNGHPPGAELEDAWNNILLFAEHTWGALNSVSEPDSEQSVKQLAIKDNYAAQGAFELADVQTRSLGQLEEHIGAPARTLVVFNPLNWKRSALMEVDLSPNQELVDMSTHQAVSVETVSEQEGFVRARFLARDLPSVGYKCFQVREVSDSQAPPAAITRNPAIENQYYRITIDAQTGAVQSIFDKQLKKELVDAQSPYKFGQYLYVTGGDGDGTTRIRYPHSGATRIIHGFAAMPMAELTVHPAARGEYLGEIKTPWGNSIKLRSSAVNTPAIDLEILMFDGEKKIEFRYTVQKTYTTRKEAVYFAFPAAVESPQFAYNTQQGWFDPSRDMLKGGCLEWFTIQKWMAVHGSGVSVGIVPIDAPLASFGDINRGIWPGEFHPQSSTIFSDVMNNYYWTNYRAGQGGTFTFRYVITSADQFDPSALSRLGWESAESPLLDSIANDDTARDPRDLLPPEGASFLETDNPKIVLVTWKSAEDGNGTILRLLNTDDQSASTAIRLLHSHVQSALLCNSVEDKLRDADLVGGAIRLAFHPHEVLTLRVVP